MRKAMFLVAFLVLTVLSVPLLGGRVAGLAGLRLRHPELVALALALQILVISVIEGHNATVLQILHIASYIVVGVFLYLNLRVPGIVVTGAGWLMNSLAITLNGGVMPASRDVYEAAPGAAEATGFLNSKPLSDPILGFLGDNFSLPESLPFHNVFSMGDVAIALGVFVTIHWATRSLLFRALERPFGLSRAASGA